MKRHTIYLAKAMEHEGDRVQMPSGTRYERMKSGAWKRVLELRNPKSEIRN